MNIISFYRAERWLYKHRMKVFAKGIQAIIFYLFNSKITGDTEIGHGTYCVCRGISTVLIPGTKIGNNCVLGLRFSTVRQFPYKDVPTIGNNVWIGPNVIVAGPVIIEDNVLIAGNSFVNKSVPKGAIVAGTPAKIIGWRDKLDYHIEENPKYKEGIAPYLENSITTAP
ncbi:MAG: serine acetyltransferase [Bacteroidaceae bacterium]|nr:serine acetyltransferase [Bacteroidaceae bacterium]